MVTAIATCVCVCGGGGGGGGGGVFAKLMKILTNRETSLFSLDLILAPILPKSPPNLFPKVFLWHYSVKMRSQLFRFVV